MLYAEFILLLFFLYVGSRFGGVGLGSFPVSVC